MTRRTFVAGSAALLLGGRRGAWAQDAGKTARDAAIALAISTAPDRHDRLVERRNFTPLPYRGELTLNPDGEHQNYTIRPCGEPMRQALVDFLVKDMGAERMPRDPNNDFYVVLKIEGKPFKLAVVDSDVTWVSIDMDKGDGNPKLMARVAERIDAAFATGKYDRLFGKTE